MLLHCVVVHWLTRAHFVFVDVTTRSSSETGRLPTPMACTPGQRHPPDVPNAVVNTLGAVPGGGNAQPCPVASPVLWDMLHKWHREVFFNGRSSVN